MKSVLLTRRLLAVLVAAGCTSQAKPSTSPSPARQSGSGVASQLTEAERGAGWRLLFDGQDGFSCWLTGFYALIRRLGFWYGDSGIFIRRAVFDTIGGVRPIALMEDYDLVRRLRRAGPTTCLAEPPLVTSSRRFAGRRPPAIVLGWVRIHLLYWLGADPAWLAQLYDSERRRSGEG